jgi:hypothetical protein
LSGNLLTKDALYPPPHNFFFAYTLLLSFITLYLSLLWLQRVHTARNLHLDNTSPSPQTAHLGVTPLTAAELEQFIYCVEMGPIYHGPNNRAATKNTSILLLLELIFHSSHALSATLTICLYFTSLQFAARSGTDAVNCLYFSDASTILL